MKKRRKESLYVLAVLFVAAAVRFYRMNWDQQIGAHPDERYIVDTAARISFPHRLNPFDVAPSFAYGHVPLYVLGITQRLLPGIDGLLLGRGLSAAFDLGSVGLTFALGRRLRGPRTGLLAATCVSLMVAHVQQAHFYTPDTLLVFFTLAALLAAVRFVQAGRLLDAGLAGGAAGLAVGTKGVAVVLGVPLAVACWSRTSGRRMAVAGCATAFGLSFAVGNPFALLDVSTFVGNLRVQTAIIGGAYDAPYTRQFHGTLPYVYPVVQQLRWGIGWATGLCALAGLIRRAVRAVRVGASSEDWVLLAWVVPFFAFVGGLYAKFPRYVLPMAPLLAVCAADLIGALRTRRPRLALALAVLVLGSLVVRCTALMGMYAAPHPWVAASEWLREEVEPGAVIAVEAWDQPLPVHADGFEMTELPLFEEETSDKWQVMKAGLERADYVIVASRRGYGSLGRWPSRYGRTAEYYRQLFEVEKGYELAACFGRYPRLGPLVFADDPTAGLAFSLPQVCRPGAGLWIRLGRLDESFVVYDHPLVLAFRVKERVSLGGEMVRRWSRRHGPGCGWAALTSRRLDRGGIATAVC